MSVLSVSREVGEFDKFGIRIPVEFEKESVILAYYAAVVSACGVRAGHVEHSGACGSCDTCGGCRGSSVEACRCWASEVANRLVSSVGGGRLLLSGDDGSLPSEVSGLVESGQVYAGANGGGDAAGVDGVRHESRGDSVASGIWTECDRFADVCGGSEEHAGDGTSVSVSGALSESAVFVSGEKTKGQLKREKAKRRKLRKQGKGVPAVVAERALESVAAESSSSVGVGRFQEGLAEVPVGLGSSDVSSQKYSYSYRDVTTVEEQRVFARQWYERKVEENKLAIQRARYNVKRNEYLDRARISEKRWEQERLSCEQKLARITEARLGSKPGYATTLLSVCEGSELPPSLSTGSDSPAELSDGTISPDSSMSVAEVNAMKKKMEDLAGRVAELSMQNEVLKKGVRMHGGTVKIEGGEAGLYDSFGCYIPPSVKYDSEAEFYLGGGADSECAFYE